MVEVETFYRQIKSFLDETTPHTKQLELTKREIKILINNLDSRLSELQRDGGATGDLLILLDKLSALRFGK